MRGGQGRGVESPIPATHARSHRVFHFSSSKEPLFLNHDSTQHNAQMGHCHLFAGEKMKQWQSPLTLKANIPPHPPSTISGIHPFNYHCAFIDLFPVSNCPQQL